PQPDPPPPEPDGWVPDPPPGTRNLVARAMGDFARTQLDLAAIPTRVARSPARLWGAVGRTQRAALALLDAARPARKSSLNGTISPLRHLGLLGRSVDALVDLKDAFGVKLHDVV